MKIYIFYLNLPDDLRLEFPKNLVDSFYEVSSSLLSSLQKKYNESSDRWYYLYAFTNNKEFSRIFKETHDMKLFTMTTKKITKEEYHDVKHKVPDIELKMRRFDGEGNSKCDILCTRNESMCIDEDLPLIVDAMMGEYSSIMYEMYKNKFIQSLDRILYCLSNKLNSDDDEESECASYNFGYGITPENITGAANRLSYRPHILNLYIKYFSLILTKEVN